MKKHYGYFYWKRLLDEYKEQTSSTYHTTPGSKPHPSESGHDEDIVE